MHVNVSRVVLVAPSKRSASRGYPLTPLRANASYVKVLLCAHLAKKGGENANYSQDSNATSEYDSE